MPLKSKFKKPADKHFKRRKRMPKLLLSRSKIFSNGKRAFLLISFTFAMSLSVTVLAAVLRNQSINDFPACIHDSEGNLPITCNQCEYFTELPKVTQTESKIISATYNQPSCLNIALKSCAPAEVAGSAPVIDCLSKKLGTDKSSSSASILNNQCERIPAQKLQSHIICKDPKLTELATPVSLLWKSNVNIRDILSIVKFPLDPSKPDAWVKWRASAESPLLVYDPDKRGRITSAFQLFGPWTFGGRAAASVKNTSFEIGPTQKFPWRHGFEPLALLDKNKDRRVSGNELKPLRLWFDVNQDGISEPSEVRDLNELGITALYYSVDAIDQHTKDIYVKTGYSRMVGSQLITGAAVDWTTEIHTSTSAVVSSAAVDNLLELFNAKGNANTELENQPQLRADAQQEIWQLEIGGSGSQETSSLPTVLALNAKNGLIAGSSYIELPLKARDNTQQGLRSMIFSNKVTGTKEKSAEGKTLLKFSSNINGKTTISKGIIAPDSHSMSGESVVINNQSKNIEYSFTWHAKSYPAL